MKYLAQIFLLFISISISAQVLEVPTLESKGINGEVKTIEWHSFQANQEQGMFLAKKDIETYDENGRLSSVITENYQNNQSYKTVYTLSRRGRLAKTEIFNPSNNLILRSTQYDYQKGLLIKTTQTQDANTVVKNYEYNDKDQLVKVEVFQNGTLSLTEFFELDEEGRRTKIKRKLPTENEAKVTSTFVYTLSDSILTSVENRTTDQGDFRITKRMLTHNKRDIRETTKRLSDGLQASNFQFFEDDAQGNWVMGEVIGSQYSRSRLVLRKFTYSDGTATGRDQMSFPEDYHGQFIRQYSQKQVAVNGKVYNSGVAFALDYTDDRIAYVSDLNSWVLLLDYDKNSNMTNWAKAEVLEGGRDIVYWSPSSYGGLSVFNAGRKYTVGTGKNNYSIQQFGNSFTSTAYIRGEVNQSFVVYDAPIHAGEVVKANLTTDHFYWGKVSDSTYLLTNRGRSVSLQKQIEDNEGNKLAMFKQDSMYYWYFLPEFRERFDNSEEGEVFPAESIYDMEKFIRENKYKVDLTSFNYTKLANTNYRLLSADGQTVTNIASKTFKTPDEKLVTYFPLTGQYLEMNDFYQLEKGKEWSNQRVNILTDSSAYVYYLYNDNESINFYTPNGRISQSAFASHRLDDTKRAYAAIVYDSANYVSYGMTYDLDKDAGFGTMRKLISNSRGAYAMKLTQDRWVIVEKGIKAKDYTFSRYAEDGNVIHFFKNQDGKTSALKFVGFGDANVADIIYGTIVSRFELEDYLKEFEIDPELKEQN